MKDERDRILGLRACFVQLRQFLINSRGGLSTCARNVSRRHKIVAQLSHRDEHPRHSTVCSALCNRSCVACLDPVCHGCSHEFLCTKCVLHVDNQKCGSGFSYNGITDAVTDLLMKVQHVTVSENSDHNSCVSLTMVWTWNFLLSRQT